MQDIIAQAAGVGQIGPQWVVARFVRRARGLSLMVGGLVVGTALSACTTGGSTFTVFADPGKYQYYACDQIAAQIKHWSTREQELRALMDKADLSAGGTVVNLLAYRADYVAATEELKVLDATARGKNCETPQTWRSNTVVR